MYMTILIIFPEQFGENYIIRVIGVVEYMVHTILGNILWLEYNPITMYISLLTADGAPNSSLLIVFKI